MALAAAGTVGWLVARPAAAILRAGFRWFNAGFASATNAYTRAVGGLLRVSVLVLVVYAGMLFATYRCFTIAPKGFIPAQDMGYLYAAIQLPDAASIERTRAAVDHVQQIAMGMRGVKHTMAIAGSAFGIGASGSNFGMIILILDDFSQRNQPGLYGTEIAATLRARCAAEVPEAMVSVLPPPPIRGIGRSGGFKFMVEDRKDAGVKTLQAQTDNLVQKGNALRKPPRPTPLLVGLFSVFRANAPQLYVDLNRAQCMTMDVPLADAFNTLQVYLGSLYVNDFNRFGRTWQVVAQADAEFRNQVEDVKLLKVRNRQGAMVPIGALADVREVNGPFILTRYNMYPAAAINGNAGPGVSSRQAIDLMQDLADRELLPGMHYEWTEMAFQELQAGNTAMWIFTLAVVMVFLVLGRPIRKLVAAAGRDPGGADVPAERDRGGDDRPVGRQHLHADRLRGPGRAGQQERDSDRGVRQAAAAGGDGPPRGGDGGLPPAAAADRDDLAGLHPRRGSAVGHQRCRCGDAAHAGAGRVQRHVGRDAVRHFSHPRVLQRHRLAGDDAGFDSRPMRWVRFITLEIFALGFLLTLVRLLRDWGRNARRRARTADPSGDTDNPK